MARSVGRSYCPPAAVQGIPKRLRSDSRRALSHHWDARPLLAVTSSQSSPPTRFILQGRPKDGERLPRIVAFPYPSAAPTTAGAILKDAVKPGMNTRIGRKAV